MVQISKVFVVVLLGLMLMTMGLVSESQATFYKGKTITVICAAPAGGGVSRAASVFVKHMSKHLAGNPNIIIKNMPGGGGLKALNYLADKAKADGLMLKWGGMAFLAKLLDFPAARFDYDQFDYIGSGSTSYSSLIRKNFPPGINSAADILKAKGFKIGGQGPSSGLDIFSKLPLDILGVDYKYIPGYKGQPQFNSAIRSEEINFLTTGANGFHIFYIDTIIKDGTVLPLYYHTPMNEKGRPIISEGYPKTVKNFVNFVEEDLGRKLTGAQYEAYKWVCTYVTKSLSLAAPKGVDKDLLSELRKAHAATVADPEFKKEYVQQFAWPIWGTGEELTQLAETYNQLSPEALAVLKKMTSNKK